MNAVRMDIEPAVSGTAVGDADASLRREQHRPRKERMRADQVHFNEREIGLHDRAACRQRVCRGAGRRRKNDAVCAVNTDLPVIDGYRKITDPAV